MSVNISSSSSTGGIGFIGLLTAALIVLKLTGTIELSWFWVLLGPFLGVMCLVLAICALTFSAVVLFCACRDFHKGFKRGFKRESKK